jgi:hypothetical protein
MHSLECAYRKAMHNGMLRKQILLRNIRQTHRAIETTAGESDFKSTDHRDSFFNCSSSSLSSSCDRVVCFSGRGVERAFATTARADLRSPHLI